MTQLISKTAVALILICVLLGSSSAALASGNHSMYLSAPKIESTAAETTINGPYILTSGYLDLSGVDVINSDGGPAVTDNNQAVVCTLLVRHLKNPTIYSYDPYGNVTNCFEGGAVEILNPQSRVTIVADSIEGDQIGVFWNGTLDLTATSVVGRQSSAVEISAYAHGVITANCTAKGDSGYYGCNAGVGGVAIYAVNHNDTVVVNGDIYAKWDYAAKAGVASTIVVNGNILYDGPRTATAGNVVQGSVILNGRLVKTHKSHGSKQ